MVWSATRIAAGVELDFTITGDVLRKGIFKFVSPRPHLDVGLLRDDLHAKAHLLDHELDVGVVCIAGFFRDAGCGS
jgi:hypothetical protein